jgi:hypothetical protein
MVRKIHLLNSETVHVTRNAQVHISCVVSRVQSVKQGTFLYFLIETICVKDSQNLTLPIRRRHA